MIVVRLPWPPKELWVNRKVHWAKRAPVAKRYRQDACVLTLVEMKRRMMPTGLHLIFHPPDRRRRDLDGMLSAMKPAIDGIADALGVDDSNFSLRLERGEPTKGGEVVAVITEGEQA